MSEKDPAPAAKKPKASKPAKDDTSQVKIPNNNNNNTNNRNFCSAM